MNPDQFVEKPTFDLFLISTFGTIIKLSHKIILCLVITKCNIRNIRKIALISPFIWHSLVTENQNDQKSTFKLTGIIKRKNMQGQNMSTMCAS